MKTISKAIATAQFEKSVFHCSPYFITCNTSWEGGVSTDSCLSQKALFYRLAEKMSTLTKCIMLALDEKPFVGKALCENNTMFAQWSNLEEIDIYRHVSGCFKKNKYYELSLPEDEAVVDWVVESNFFYLSYISFFLPKSKIVIIPTCHTEILFFCEDKQKYLDLLHDVTSRISDNTFLIEVKSY